MNPHGLRVPATIKSDINEKNSNIRDSTLLLPETELLRTLRVDAGLYKSGKKWNLPSNYTLFNLLQIPKNWCSNSKQTTHWLQLSKNSYRLLAQ